MIRHPSGLFAYTDKVNELENRFSLHWLLDYIAANLKRVRKRISGTQEWVFSLDTQHRAKIDVYSRSKTFPYRRRLEFTFTFTVLDYTGPPLTFFLEDDVLFTEGEPDVEI
jgi:hypothetical protein